jgi:hypothetical protein
LSTSQDRSPVDERIGDCAFTDLLHEQKSTGCAKLSHAYSSALGGSVIAVCIWLGGPCQRLFIDILPNVRQFAISNCDVEDPVILERFIRGFDFSSSETDEQDPVSLRHELGRLRD